MRIPVTLQLVADVLCVPRIEFPDYPSCEHLRTMSRDELMSSFCECPTAWGEHLFTPCRPFAKGVWGTHIPITLQLVVDVLRVPRIEFPDYPSCERLRTVSRDELMSSFCERPTAWGERLFTPCRPFAKGPRFMNMVMTFVLHPLSHYNSITEPRARFLLSLLEHPTLDFPSLHSVYHRCSSRFGVPW